MTNNVCCVEELVESDGCTGCAGCANVCPLKAIEMRLVPEGFYRPEVNYSLCNGCGFCVKKCPVLSVTSNSKSNLQLATPQCYAAWSTDTETHLESSSGGVFSEISKFIVECGGSVFGCSWSNKIEPEHIEVTTSKDIMKLRGSKYVPSAIGSTLARAAANAREGRNVLFSGTPCQVSALSQMLDATARSNVTLIDFICHGVPSLTLFTVYKRWIFNDEPVSNFTFRNKSLCLQTIVARSLTGKMYEQRASEDPFFRLGYGDHLSMMKSCFSCKFASAPRVSDITLGDFWGAPPELDHQNGASVIIVNSPRGKELINKAVSLGTIKLLATELAIIARMNPRATGGEWQPQPKRTAFLQDIAKGRSFTWIYWNWYLPIRIKEKIRDVFLGGFIWFSRMLKLKKMYQWSRRIIAFKKAH